MFGDFPGCSIPLPRKAPNSLFTAFSPSVKVFPFEVFHHSTVPAQIFFDIFPQNRYDGGERYRKVM
jgi:hypothetical protein